MCPLCGCLLYKLKSSSINPHPQSSGAAGVNRVEESVTVTFKARLPITAPLTPLTFSVLEDYSSGTMGGGVNEGRF